MNRRREETPPTGILLNYSLEFEVGVVEVGNVKMSDLALNLTMNLRNSDAEFDLPTVHVLHSFTKVKTHQSALFSLALHKMENIFISEIYKRNISVSC